MSETAHDERGSGRQRGDVPRLMRDGLLTNYAELTRQA